MEEEEEKRKRQKIMKEEEESKQKLEENSADFEIFKRSKVEVYSKGKLEAKELSGSTNPNALSTQEDRVNTLDKTIEFATVHGVFYEVKMCMLVFLKLLNLKATFSLNSNLKEAKTVGDFVVHYKYNDENEVDVNGALLIHLKHEDKSDINKFILFYKGKPYFSLLEFFLSFSVSDWTENRDIFSRDLVKKHYLILTNANLDITLLTEDTDFSSIWDDFSGYGKVLKLKESEEYKDFLKFLPNLYYIYFGSAEDQRKAANEINNSINTGEFTVKGGKLNDDSRNRSLEELKKVCYNFKIMNINKTIDFLLKMRICFSEANVDMLDGLIRYEIQSALTVSQAETEKVFTDLHEKFTVWNDIESYYLTQNSQIWADISKETRDMRSKNMEMRNLGIKFDDVSVSSMVENIQQFRFLNIVSGGESTTLSSLKMWQALESLIPQCYLLVSIRECTQESHDIWNTWPNRWCKTLAIEFDVEYNNAQFIKDQLITSLRSNPSSKVIFITSQNRNIVIDNITDVPCNIHNHYINFDQLDKNSQTQIFEAKTLKFQGKNVGLKDVFMKKQLKMLDTDQMTNLVKGELTLGKSTSQYKQEGYISRNIQVPCVREEILLLPVTRKACLVIAIESLKSPQDFILTKNVYAVEDLLKLNSEDVKHSASKDHYYAILNNEKEGQEFQSLCQIFSDVHCIKEYDNFFIWKKSKGDINIIKDYLYYHEIHIITEEDFLINDSKLPVLIYGEPGMGKTSLLKHMAMLLKENYPYKWIVLIELSQCCDIFKNCDEVGKEKVFEIICHALSETNVSLLSQNFENMQNFVVLLDGFDEIGPHYTNVVQQIIKYLIRSSCFVYVTCRPSDSIYLEETFDVISHVLQPLDNERQEKLLIQSWKSKGKSKYDIDFLQQTTLKSQAMYLIDLNSKHLNDPNRSFTGNPLHILMLSEIYDFANLEVSATTEHVVNVFQMFREYVRKKCEVYMEKMNCNIANSTVKENLDNFMSDIIEVNKKVSAAKIFWNELQTSGLEILFTKDNAFSCSVKAGIFKETESIFPKYTHRLFIEYFAALWLVDNYLRNVQLINEIISQNEFEMIRKFYDFKCSEDNLFHTAILTSDVVYINSNLENASLLNSKDSIGRTALHLTASRNDVTITQILLDHHIDIAVKDNIGWTALEYAIHSHSWEVLNLILAIYQYTEHESRLLWETAETYQNDIIFLCCKKDLLNLLEFVCKNVSLNKEFNLPRNEHLHYKTTHSSFTYNYFKLYKTYIPLHVAAMYNQIDTIKILQNNKCSIDMTDELGLTLLHIASSWGYTDLLKYLIKEGLSVNCCSNDKNMPLHMACIGGHTSTIRELVENGADVNYENLYLNTPLLECCWNCNVDVIKYLVDHDADIDHYNKYGRTAAHMAIKQDNIEVFKYCVDVGKNINHPDQYGNTVLFYVCRNHDLDLVKYCVDHGADMYLTNNNGNTVLTYASDHATMETIKYCVEATDLMDRSNNNGDTVLFTASKAGRLDIVDYCVEKGADLNYKNNDGETALFIASLAGRLDIVKYCKEKDAALDHENNDNETALFYAICCTDFEKDFDIVNFLVDNGAVVNHISIDGCTPLILALSHDKLNIAHYLIQHGANINHADNDGNTALMYVAMDGNANIFEYCVNHDADINLINNDGDTALLLSLKMEHLDIVLYCLQQRANCNQVNNNGDTPLLIAAKKGYIDVVMYCHKQGADLNHSNNNGHTALFLATIYQHEEIVQYLEHNGANPV